ncbi:MAG: NUDIX hydrolase [Rickettsiales bacterium]
MADVISHEKSVLHTAVAFLIAYNLTTKKCVTLIRKTIWGRDIIGGKCSEEDKTFLDTLRRELGEETLASLPQFLQDAGAKEMPVCGNSCMTPEEECELRSLLLALEQTDVVKMLNDEQFSLLWAKDLMKERALAEGRTEHSRCNAFYLGEFSDSQLNAYEEKASRIGKILYPLFQRMKDKGITHDESSCLKAYTEASEYTFLPVSEIAASVNLCGGFGSHSNGKRCRAESALAKGSICLLFDTEELRQSLALAAERESSAPA